MLSCEFREIVKNAFFIEHLRWLLLKVKKSRKIGQKQKTLITASKLINF